MGEKRLFDDDSGSDKKPKSPKKEKKSSKDLDPDEAAAFEEDIAGTMCAGILTGSRPRELLCEMPIMYIKAVVIQPTWVPESVGYIRPESHLYNCPVYATTFRGPTFIFVATLRTKESASKWISAGVALSFQTDG